MATAAKKAPQKKQPYFLRPHEVEAVEKDRAGQLAVLESNDPRMDKNAAREALKRIDKRLEQAPPDLTPEQRDKTAKMVETLEQELKDGLLSHEEMRRAPPGAVDQNMKYMRRNKAKIMAWKNGLVALSKGAPQGEVQDLTNIDRLRPRESKLNMDGAIIPDVRSFFPMTEVFSGAHPNGSTWEEIFGSGDPEKDALAAQVRVLQEEMRALREGAAPKAPAQQPMPQQKAPQAQNQAQRR